MRQSTDFLGKPSSKFMIMQKCFSLINKEIPRRPQIQRILIKGWQHMSAQL